MVTEAQRVVIGLSGGVDSSVAAWLLKEQGYDVVGIFMKNWHDESVTLANECPWIEDSNDAMLVAQHLGIPFQVMDFSAAYKARIVDYMYAEYAAGRTPNPDVLCNREIKFDVFLDAAMRLGAAYVATGHYCRREAVQAGHRTEYRLLAGRDAAKDQSYFLCQVSQEQLARALFPVGELQKSQVRCIAEEAGLITARKKDSQGLCFVGKISLPDFLQQQLAPNEGDIVEIPAEAIAPATAPPARPDGMDEETLAALCRPHVLSHHMGRVVGRHRGAHYYTIGQRKGLNVGGKTEPLFIIGTDVAANVVYTGMGDSHPGLYRYGLSMQPHEVHWLRPSQALTPGAHRRYMGRIRYRQPLEPCTLYRTESTYHLVFDTAQRGIAPGQFAAWYDGEELAGSGVIG